MRRGKAAAETSLAEGLGADALASTSAGAELLQLALSLADGAENEPLRPLHMVMALLGCIATVAGSITAFMDYGS